MTLMEAAASESPVLLLVQRSHYLALMSPAWVRRADWDAWCSTPVLAVVVQVHHKAVFLLTESSVMEMLQVLPSSEPP